MPTLCFHCGTWTHIIFFLLHTLQPMQDLEQGSRCLVWEASAPRSWAVLLSISTKWALLRSQTTLPSVPPTWKPACSKLQTPGGWFYNEQHTRRIALVFYGAGTLQPWFNLQTVPSVTRSLNFQTHRRDALSGSHTAMRSRNVSFVRGTHAVIPGSYRNTGTSQFAFLTNTCFLSSERNYPCSPTNNSVRQPSCWLCSLGVAHRPAYPDMSDTAPWIHRSIGVATGWTRKPLGDQAATEHWSSRPLQLDFVPAFELFICSGAIFVFWFLQQSVAGLCKAVSDKASL